MAKIKSGDEVIVISGKDRGKTGKVQRVDPKKDKVVVEGINIVKRHQRPSALNPNAEAGVIEREGAIHISNVMLVDPDTKKGTRVGITRENGKRVRIARRSGAKVD
ncbi:MAG: 50S ribosomal protein L24 [Baekduia sp.]